MSKVEGAGSCPARGRRYSAGQRKEILEFAAEHGDAAAVAEYGCSQWSITNWRKKAAEATKRREEGVGSGAESASPAVDDRELLVLELWRQQPGLGPSQIRNLLKRKGFKASVSTVRAIMVEHGYVQLSTSIEKGPTPLIEMGPTLWPLRVQTCAAHQPPGLREWRGHRGGGRARRPGARRPLRLPGAPAGSGRAPMTAEAPEAGQVAAPAECGHRLRGNPATDGMFSV